MIRLGKPFTLLLFLTTATSAQELTLTPSNPTAIYSPGDRITWTISLPKDTPPPTTPYTYTLKKNNQDLLKSGPLDLSTGTATLSTTLTEPAMLYLDITPPFSGEPTAPPSPSPKHFTAGAAIAPTQLQPSAPRPADFDSFWQSKIDLLHQIPPNPTLTPADSGHPDVDYAIIKMDHVNHTHIYGQLAKPHHPGKYPALVIFQWASPPYPLQKSWVTDHAAHGWLTLNIEPHDVLPTEPKSYYDSLPAALKNYQTIGQDDRDKSYFLQMYLADYRAVDYLASRPDWDGKTLVVMGTSMGGQQSLAVAGLHPRITHLIVNEPAGCDTNGPLRGRQAGYPFFPANNPKVMATSLYFDPVNFAPHITAHSLVAMGFTDTIAPPAGIWTAFNQIQGPKEAVPMPTSPHNHQATPDQQRPYTTRSTQWLTALAQGTDPSPLTPSPGTPGEGRGEGSAQRSLDHSTPAPSAVALHPSPGIPIPGPTTAPFDDHQNMMDQLGIHSLRPGANPHATFTESTANPYKDSLPDVLTLKDGTKVTTPAQWPKRRAEIVEDFEREIYGRIPKDVPPVTWEVTSTTPGTSAGIPTLTKTLLGHVDNSAYPQLSVDIQATFTIPAHATSPVPLIISFTPPPRRPATNPIAATPRVARLPSGSETNANAAPPWTDQALSHGWAYCTLNPISIQPDNNHLTTEGIIALTNHGHPRTPDQWGALRAWAWGASRLVDYFESHPDSHVDPTKVGIEGVSRYGKAALVTQAFDPRIAVGLIASSGEGGSKLHRHVYGEAVENLAGGLYYWMAGNFLKYASADPPKTPADMPVDSHELIALCAPRPCFISHGVPEKGDAPWIDARGSFMSAVLATPVYRLLGKHGLDTPGDYLTDPMPPVGALIGGDLAWRQHEGGHDVTPNWPSFFTWISHYIPTTPSQAQGLQSLGPSSSEISNLKSGISPSSLIPSPGTPGEGQGEGSAPRPLDPSAPTSPSVALNQSPGIPIPGPTPDAAATPTPRPDPNSQLAHLQLLQKARTGHIDLYFLGDSITRRWGCTDPQYKDLLANWTSNFHGWNAANFGWGGDTTQNILWRLDHGELDDVHPKVIVLLAGTNNVGPHPATPAQITDITAGIEAILHRCHTKAPNATILLTAIFPRNDNMDAMPAITQINSNLSKLADGHQIRFLNINPQLADPDGHLYPNAMNPDQLHPTLKTYQLWADALKPLLTTLLGPPSNEDHAPPPTGDPTATQPH